MGSPPSGGWGGSGSCGHHRRELQRRGSGAGGDADAQLQGERSTGRGGWRPRRASWQTGQRRAAPPERLRERSRVRVPGQTRASCQPIPASPTTSMSRAPRPAAWSGAGPGGRGSSRCSGGEPARVGHVPDGPVEVQQVDDPDAAAPGLQEGQQSRRRQPRRPVPRAGRRRRPPACTPARRGCGRAASCGGGVADGRRGGQASRGNWPGWLEVGAGNGPGGGQRPVAGHRRPPPRA